MPKVTKTLGNNKVRACESPDFAHNKEDVSVLTHPHICFYRFSYLFLILSLIHI